MCKMADDVKWLRWLIADLGEKAKEDVVGQQEGVEAKLRTLLGGELGPTGRRLLGRAFAVMYERGNTLGLHGMIGRCCDALRSKDEGQSPANTKRNVLVVLGMLYESFGLMAGSSYMEVVQLLVKVAKQPEYRVEALICAARTVKGMGQSSSSAHKEITKLFRSHLTDRSMEVRKVATECGVALAAASPLLCAQELESTAALCFKATEGSTEVVRSSVAELLAQLLIASQQPLPPHQRGKVKATGVQEALGVLAQGFTKGSGGLFRGSGGELLKTGVGGASGEVRVTATQAYVLFLRGMGPHWVERNAPVLLHHILDLLSSAKTIATHIGAVYARNCVQFILGEAFVRMLRESVQLYVARLLCSMARQSVAQGDRQAAGEADKKATPASNQNELVCILKCLGQLVVKLNTAALPLVVGDSASLAPDGSNAGPLLELILLALVHTSLAVRLAAAWCLRCVAGTLQTQLTTLLDLCLSKLRHFRGAADAVSGYSLAVAALLASARQSQLGLHTSKIKLVLVSAEELLSSSDDSQKLSAPLSRAAWTMIGASCTTGSALLKPHLGRVVQLWKETFPRSMKELQVEQTQTNSEGLFAVIERRAGALASMGHVIQHCSELVDEQVLKRVLVSVNSTVAILGSRSTALKTPMPEVNAKMALLRLRLYRTLISLPPAAFEGCLSGILRELVGEFSLSTNISATTTSLMKTLVDFDVGMVLEAWSRETDHQTLEQQLEPHSAAGAGSLEHDPHTVFTHEGDSIPGPLPLGVAVIDASVLLFGRVFPRVSQSHRQQLLGHFLPALRQGKSQKQLAVQINMFSACLCAFKNLAVAKDTLGGHEVTSVAHDIVQLALSSPDQTVRCMGAEALGRLAQVCSGSSQVGLVQQSFDLLKTSRDISLRTGHSLGLGCVHRCLGAVGAGQHIGMSVALLLALAKDSTASVCQVWALFALALIVDSGGPLFRAHTESALQGVAQLLLTTPSQEVGVYRCLGRCLNSLITSLGPELQLSSASISEVRERSLLCSQVLLDHPDPFVQAAGLSCLQQLQVYAPQFVDLDKTVRAVCAAFSDPAVVLRRTVANCLRQFSQVEPAGVRRVASAALSGNLEELVVRRLDWEVHEGLVEDLKEVLLSLLSSLAPQDPMYWLQFCNRLLAASSEGKPLDLPSEGAEEEDEEAGALHTAREGEGEKAAAPNWQTRLFAMELVQKVYSSCRSNPAHFDQSLAVKQRQQTGGDFLVFHLSDVVRTSFLAATSDVLQLRVGGYHALGEVVGLFAQTPDPDYPGHSLLELYQAQIGAALRPAFTADTPPHLTAIACQVCGQWLACGVSGDVGDLSRVQQLLVTSLQRIQRRGGAQPEGGGAQESRDTQFGEAVSTLESLAVLRAWAELYIKISLNSDPLQQEKGTELVQDHLALLAKNWLAAVRDHALISLPPQFTSQLPARGAFFTLDTVDSVRGHYRDCWHVLLHATTLWQSGRGHLAKEPNPAPNPQGQFPGTVPLEGDASREVFYLLLGLVVQALCDASVLEADPVIMSLMQSLHTLLSSPWARVHVANEGGVAVEALSVLHRLLLTCKREAVHLAALRTARLVANNLTTVPHPTPHAAGLSKVLMRVAACFLKEHLPLHQDGCQKAPSTREARELLSASVDLLPSVLHLSPEDEVEGNAPAVLYMLLTAIAQPSIYSACDAAVLTALKRALAAVSNPAPLVQSCLAALMEHQPAAPVDLTALGCDLKLVVMATLLLTPGVVVTREVPQVSFAVDFITGCLSQDAEPVVRARAVRTCCLLLEGKAPAQNAYLVCRLVPCLVGVVTGAVEQGPELTKDGAGLALQAAQGVEGVCLAPDTDQRLAELYFTLLLSLLGEGLPEGAGQHATHTFAIQRLKELGPLHITAMRSVVLSDPQQKAKLERALQTSSTLPPPATSRQRAPAAPKAPTITLRQDFSNFAF